LICCVIGAGGQLGSDVAAVVEQDSNMGAVRLSRRELDVTNRDAVRGVLADRHPAVVINCAAFHDVDLCEDEPAQAFSVNALGALNVANACLELEAKHIFISTDFVFDGKSRQPYAEEDPANPLNVYGVSKLAGEFLTQQNPTSNSLVIRTASLFGLKPPSGKEKNFVQAIVERARSGQRLEVVHDITMSPTFTRHLASAILALVRADAVGTFHVVNEGMCTWFEFAQRILALSGIEQSVTPISQSTYSSKATRPSNSALSTRKVSTYWQPPTWHAALEEYLREAA
jgi:dTDP-4-dehydrorhamnose reductase